MACGTCPSTLPPVSSDYKPKGSYESIADMKTCQKLLVPGASLS